MSARAKLTCWRPLLQLVHAVVDAICGRAMPTYASQSKQLSFEQFHSVKEALFRAVMTALRDASSPHEVLSVLTDACTAMVHDTSWS